jgi:uncharacterized short protein YbdD (DUF466 family)
MKSLWRLLQALAGEDAYERYLRHFAIHHDDDGRQPLDRNTFERHRLEERWNGVRRCC